MCVAIGLYLDPRLANDLADFPYILEQGRKKKKEEEKEEEEKR